MYNYARKMNEYTKKERQQILRKLINRRGIGDQRRLLGELKKRGIDATQATISRDFQEMGVIKVRVGPGEYRYELSKKISKDILWSKLQVLFDNFVVDIKGTNNLILVKTSPGNANGVGSFIDQIEIPEILGTVAGDDTILVVVASAKSRGQIEKRFKELLG